MGFKPFEVVSGGTVEPLPKLEYILRNVILTLLDQPKATFNDIPKMLLNAEYQKECIEHIVNKNVIRFWQQEFPKYSKTDLLPVLNKVGSFLSIPMLNKILVENTQQISLRYIMDNQKILLVNLSKGTLGVDGAHLLGSLLLTSLSSAGFSRTNIEEQKRVPFYIYLDEFQNYTTASLTTMLSELRKFKIGFVLAHQYLHQLQTDIKNAVLGNIGTIICFKLGQADAKYMAQEFYPIFETSDFTNLEHFHIYLKLLINGKSPQAFSAKTITTDDVNYKMDIYINSSISFILVSNELLIKYTMKTQQLCIPEFGSHVVELHYTRPLFEDMFHITNAKGAHYVLREFVNPKQLDLRECFWVILLSNANRVLAVSEVATGTTRGVLTNPKYIFQLALLTNASALILGHVHPSGNLNFSKSDISETKKILRIAKTMEITLLDHLIITSESYASMAQENML